MPDRGVAVHGSRAVALTAVRLEVSVVATGVPTGRRRLISCCTVVLVGRMGTNHVVSDRLSSYDATVVHSDAGTAEGVTSGNTVLGTGETALKDDAGHTLLGCYVIGAFLKA